MNRSVVVVQLGRMRYNSAWQLQQKYAKAHLDYKAGKSERVADNVLLLVEHEPVYTIGLRTDGYTISDEEKLKSLGAEFFKTNRGGLITFHGPGQLVAYPIINLKHFNLGIRDYICDLEKSIISTCDKFGLRGEISPHTGVWINDKKVAAIGVHGSRYITTHGIGLNCNVDLKWFKHIVPCGIEDKGVTSLTQELQREVTIQATAPHFVKAFSQQFKCDIKEIRTLNQDEVFKET